MARVLQGDARGTTMHQHMDGAASAAPRAAGLPAGASPAPSYVPAPGENVMCHGKLKATGAACKNHALDNEIYCLPHLRAKLNAG